MPVPPLQWIELTDLLSASPEPRLKDASIGYDGNGNLLIFGGESQSGFPTGTTYTINLKGLQWTTPTAPSGLTASPSERFAAIGGDDSAASYRHGHVVIDGEGADDTAASTIWEFDYTSSFWSIVNVAGTAPSARWGAAGGIDPRVTNNALTNTLYMAGGFDGKKIYDLSEVWAFDIAGTLSSNLPNQTTGTWSQKSISNTIAGRVGIGGTVLGQKIVAVGGCTSASSSQAILDASCAVQDAQVIDTSNGGILAPKPCLAARIDPVVVPNMNSGSSVFGDQVFVLLGTFNSTLWNDGGGLKDGEVAVLNTGSGDWARVLPSGDPSSSDGKPKFPVPRQGAAALAWNGPLVGSTSLPVTDTIIFGGSDVNGTYLSDVWLLRAYNGAVTSSNQKWSGYGSGSLTTGISADGQGVTVQYLSECATFLGTSTPSSTAPTGSTTSGAGSNPSSTGTGTGSPSTSSGIVYNVSMVHKFLPAVSVALVLPALALYRLAGPSIGQPHHIMGQNMGIMYLGIVVGMAAYALGIVGLATAFTSINTTSTLAKRSSSSIHLQTAHAKAGVALFAALYLLVPLLQLLSICLRRSKSQVPDPHDGKMRSESTMEKLSMTGNGRAMSPSGRSERTSQDGHPEGKKRVRSWAGIGTWAGVSTRRSNETATDDQAPSHRSFEVVNRPARQRRASGNSLAAFSDPRPTHTPRNLSDMSWLDPRRSASGMGGESGHGLSPVDRRDTPWTPGTPPMEITSTNGLMLGQHGFEHPILPSPFEGFIHVLFHALLLALTALSLAALFQRGPIAAFAVFLAWTLAFYGLLIGLSWNGRPRKSILSVIFSRLRAEPARFSPVPRAGSPAGSRPLSMNESVAVPFPSDGRGPYHHHQPPYRAASAGLDHDYPMSTTLGHDVYDDDEEDEDTRQRRIEEELSRRDVSIVTVPKRRLYLLNPNPPEADDEAHGR